MTHDSETASMQSLPTVIEFVLDETGSMTSYKNKTIAGYNEFLNDQRSVEGICLMTLTKFHSAEINTPYTDLDVHMVPDITENTFQPGRMTNLHDTIVSRVMALKNRLKHWDIKPQVLFVCMTDGDDNMSKYSVSETRKVIEQAIENEGWTMVYLGAHSGALEAADQLGFPSGNVKAFNGVDIAKNIKETAQATVAYRATAKAEASKAFFG